MKKVSIKNKSMEQLLSILHDCTSRNVDVEMQLSDSKLYLIKGDLVRIYPSGKIEEKINGKIKVVDEGMECIDVTQSL